MAFAKAGLVSPEPDWTADAGLADALNESVRSLLKRATNAVDAVLSAAGLPAFGVSAERAWRLHVGHSGFIACAFEPGMDWCAPPNGVSAVFWRSVLAALARCPFSYVSAAHDMAGYGDHWLFEFESLVDTYPHDTDLANAVIAFVSEEYVTEPDEAEDHLCDTYGVGTAQEFAQALRAWVGAKAERPPGDALPVTLADHRWALFLQAFACASEHAETLGWRCPMEGDEMLPPDVACMVEAAEGDPFVTAGLNQLWDQLNQAGEAAGWDLSTTPPAEAWSTLCGGLLAAELTAYCRSLLEDSYP